ncbi:MAG: c-type cytochrome domain-containing protein, partial [Vicinamibacterales bacterium]
MRVPVLGAMVLMAALGVSGRSDAGQQAAPARATVDTKATVDKYCVNCHNDRRKIGGLSLQSVDLADTKASGEVLEKVVRKLRGGVMPPVGMPRPEPAAYSAFRQTIERQL